MPISSSNYVIDAYAQADGSREVMETHTDNTGRVFNVRYRLPTGQGDTEAQAFLSARVAGLNTQLAESEAEQVIGS